ncbi:MAG: hypothetical protein UR60_C0024G0015, partial [Candidatus Moranbacteria bacterium GW2011_GWF2_34_56]
ARKALLALQAGQKVKFLSEAMSYRNLLMWDLKRYKNILVVRVAVFVTFCSPR